jgi:WD40 repeat protein
VAHDLRRVVAASAFEIVFIEIGPDRLTRLGPVGGFVFRAAISRDGRRIAAGLADGRLLLWQPDSGAGEPRSLGRRAGFISGLLFLPDGEGLVVTDETGSVYRMDLMSGRGAEIGRHEARIFDAQLSPAGRRLVTSDTNGEVRLWEPASSGVLVLRGGVAPRSVEFIGEDWLLAAGLPGRDGEDGLARRGHARGGEGVEPAGQGGAPESCCRGVSQCRAAHSGAPEAAFM